MKYLFVFLLVVFVGCGGGDTSESKKPKLKEYSLSEVSINDLQMAFFRKDKKPVTGIVKDTFENGQISRHFVFKNGMLDGLNRHWYENGQLAKEWNYKNGEKDVSYKEWYENGQLAKEYNSKNGKVDDSFKQWYDNGQLQNTANYKNGKVDGLLRQWHRNGQIEHENNYKNGEFHGLHRQWYENGQLAKENNYKNGEAHGLHRQWSDSGRLVSDEMWENGEFITDDANADANADAVATADGDEGADEMVDNTNYDVGQNDISKYVRSKTFRKGNFKVNFHSNGWVILKIDRGSYYGTEMKGLWSRYGSNALQITKLSFTYGHFDASNNPDLNGIFYLQRDGSLSGEIGDYTARTEWIFTPQ